MAPAHVMSAALGIAFLLSLGGCAPFSGYAQDPATDSALPADLKDGFTQPLRDQYAAADPATRRVIRDKIIDRQLTAYDREFEEFVLSLTGGNNVFALSTDTALLAMGATGTAVAGAAAKSGFLAASTFITGLRGAVDRDLYYQRTLPALIAQMRARRLRARVPIVQGLSQDDTSYPLQRALADLGTLRAAGSIDAAIAATVQDAGETARQAEILIEAAPATAQEKSAQPLVNRIRARIAALTDQQPLRMMQLMEPVLQARASSQVAQLRTADSTKQRLANAQAAKQFLFRWRQIDPSDTTSLKQWTDALDVVEKTR